MKQYLLSIGLYYNLLQSTIILSCPCSINTDDPLPFFLQESNESNENDNENDDDDHETTHNDTTQKS